MKRLAAGLAAALMLAGCALNRYQSDISNNRYAEKQRYADAQAPYVGEWTASSKIGIRSVKIKADGSLKVCLSTSGGTKTGKVYLEDGVPALILETGAKVGIIEANSEFLILDVYGDRDTYYAGLVQDECISAFSNF